MAIFIKLRQSKFKDEQRGGKWFAQTVSQGEVHTNEIARTIEENSTFKRGEVKGMIDELVETMTRMLQQGETVVLDGFGRFKLTAVSTGADTPEDFDLKKNITGVKCNFIASGQREGLEHKVTKSLSNGTEVKWMPKKKK